MKAWLAKFSDRERRLLLIGVVLVSLALAWVLIYQPVNQYIGKQVSTKQRLSEQLNEMQAMASAAGPVSQTMKLPVPAGVTFSTWIDQQLRQVNLQDHVNRTEPIDQNKLSVWFQGVSFDQMIDWVQMLSDNYSVTVDQIDVNVVDASLGMVNVRMRLVR